VADVTDGELDYVPCPTCGAEMDSEQCWYCHGEGGFHDCGEDCCPCLDKDEITEDCCECDGTGRKWFCPNAASHAGVRRG
jgi:hypothetical protein